MPVTKYRSVEQMPSLGARSPTPVDERIRALWKRAALLAPPAIVPRGVTRFRTIEDANAEREERSIERMRSSRSDG